jgi:LuxR family maltose regulon positive regulatory protein
MALIIEHERGLRSWVPRLPATWVSRSRLLGALDRGSDRALTTVIGPPGLGKTALVAEWVGTRPDAAIVWLTLDPRDNDSTRLASALGAACASTGVHVDPRARDLRALLSSVRASALDRPVVLVLDDAQELGTRRIWDALLRVEDTEPFGSARRGLHVVVISSADPPLGIQRLRVHGQLSELRAADLCFDREETAELLRNHGLDPEPSVVSSLCEWSGGWIAALILAVHAMVEAPELDLLSLRDDAEAQLADFLVHESLAHLSDSDRTFVLRAAVADVLTPELASELTGAVDARARLRRLARRGAFLLEEERGHDRFRFHGLMAALLRAQLANEDQAEATRLTARASGWYADHGLHQQAEDHALRAGDWATLAAMRAARLRADIVAGRAMTDVLRDVPPADAARPDFAPLLAISAIERGDVQTAVRYVRTLPAAGSDVDDVVLLAEVERAFGAGPTGGGATQSLVDRATATSDDPALTGHALIRYAELSAMEGHFERARSVLRRAGVTALADERRADVGALRRLFDAIDGVVSAPVYTDDGGDGSGDAGTPFTSAADVLSSALIADMTGDTVRARPVFDTDVPAEVRASALLRSVRAALLAAAAVSDVSRPVEVVERTPPAIRTLVATGRLEYIDDTGAVAVAGGAGELGLARARRALAARSPRDVLARLHSVREVVMHPRTQVEVAVLEAIAEDELGHEAAGVRHLEAALTLSDATGVRAPLVAWGSRIQALLDRHLWEIAGRQPYAVQLSDRLRTTTFGDVVEPLTERERAVLRHLQTMMSNAEIATEMLVSVNTVKTHLKAIYRKLGVDRRRDAVLCGRRAGLL